MLLEPGSPWTRKSLEIRHRQICETPLVLAGGQRLVARLERKVIRGWKSRITTLFCGSLCNRGGLAALPAGSERIGFRRGGPGEDAQSAGRRGGGVQGQEARPQDGGGGIDAAGHESASDGNLGLVVDEEHGYSWVGEDGANPALICGGLQGGRAEVALFRQPSEWKSTHGDAHDDSGRCGSYTGAGAAW